jgi:excisionase family DNA binding protein
MKTHTPERERAALNVREAAALLGISTRHLHALVSAGRLPKPVKLGKSARWNREALEAWLRDAHERANVKGGSDAH